MSEIISFPKSEETRAETIINSAQSFDQLKSGLQELGRIKGSDGNIYSADELCDMVENVKEGTLSVNFLTRTFGLREKVRFLLEGSDLEGQTREAVQSSAQLIAVAEDFQQLEQILQTQVKKIVNDKGQSQEASVLLESINDVRTKGELLSVVTRSEGLRQKVTELYAQEAIAQARSVEEIQAVIVNIYIAGGAIASSDGIALDRNELLEIIRMTQAGDLPAQLLTRAYGLREKVMELRVQKTNRLGEIK